MSSRGQPPFPGMTNHRLAHGTASAIQLPPELVEKKLVEEMRRLAGENHQLAEAEVILRTEIVSAKEEVQKQKALIRSIEAESNIQIRVSIEKVVKMELECKEAPRVKMELENSHKDARELVVVIKDLTARIERISKELEIAHTDIERLPAVISKLENMREEHHRLCTTFEYEKQRNVEKVDHLRALERDLINMARRVERLRADMLCAENALKTPPPAPSPASYGGLHTYSEGYLPPATIQGNGHYYCPSTVVHDQMGQVQMKGNGPYYCPSTVVHDQMGAVQMNGMIVHPYVNSVASPPPPPPMPPSPPPPPPPDPPVSGQGSGGDENTPVKGENASTDWRGGGGGCESSESWVSNEA